MQVLGSSLVGGFRAAEGLRLGRGRSKQETRRTPCRAVKAGLKGLKRADGLRGNPLLTSRLVQEQVRDSSETTAEDTLRKLLIEATNALNTGPKQQKYFRAVERTYLKPAPSQEAAAEMLDLPFSTFRRHLTRGVDAVAAWLWRRETA